MDQLTNWMDWINRILGLSFQATGFRGEIVYGDKAGRSMRIPYRKFMAEGAPAGWEAECRRRTYHGGLEKFEPKEMEALPVPPLSRLRERIKIQMTDTYSKEQRSVAMSKVRSADTRPEWILRCGLHKLGFRYCLGNSRLPGRPDLLFPKYRAVVFVHGCYWHRHPGCKDASTPKSNVDFWASKFAENMDRDRRTERALFECGWRVMVVWECELVSHTVEAIHGVALWLRQGTDVAGEFRYDEPVVDRAKLLAAAEEKVRYRIASYDEKTRPE